MEKATTAQKVQTVKRYLNSAQAQLHNYLYALTQAAEEAEKQGAKESAEEIRQEVGRLAMVVSGGETLRRLLEVDPIEGSQEPKQELKAPAPAVSDQKVRQMFAVPKPKPLAN